MKKLFFVLLIAMITKTANAQAPRHIEVVVSDTLLLSIDSAFWNIYPNIDFNTIKLDSSITRQKNQFLENKTRREIGEDSVRKIIRTLNQEIKNLKDVSISDILILDNTIDSYNSAPTISYVTTSETGMKAFINFCIKNNINVKLMSAGYKKTEMIEKTLRKKLFEKSKNIASASLQNYNGKSMELLSISQSEDLNKPSFRNLQYLMINANVYKELLESNINFRMIAKLTLKFDYLVK